MTAHPAPRRFDSDEKDRLRAIARHLLDDGASIAEVARTIGVSWPTIRQWFPDARVMTMRESTDWARFMQHHGNEATS